MSNSMMTYREITRDELPKSAEIVFTAFNQMAEQNGYPKTPDVDAVITRLEEYLEDAVPGLLYGGFVDGVQVGFFMLRKLGIDEETWEISMLAVDPAQQRKGYGSKLISCALQKILDFKGVLAVCAVTEGCDHVLELLAREGFTCEASGVPVGGLSIWMLRKDMKNAAAAASCSPEACAGCSGGCNG